MPSPQNLNALQKLISEHLEVTGERLADVADRGGLPRQTLSALLHRAGPNGIPRRATLQRLADGLEVDLHTVEAAAAAAASANGMEETLPDARLAQLISYARKLDDRHLKALSSLARALARVE